jgi:hypothetical protein
MEDVARRADRAPFGTGEHRQALDVDEGPQRWTRSTSAREEEIPHARTALASDSNPAEVECARVAHDERAGFDNDRRGQTKTE